MGSPSRQPAKPDTTMNHRGPPPTIPSPEGPADSGGSRTGRSLRGEAAKGLLLTPLCPAASPPAQAHRKPLLPRKSGESQPPRQRGRARPPRRIFQQQQFPPEDVTSSVAFLSKPLLYWRGGGPPVELGDLSEG